jgi:hypothetical protein
MALALNAFALWLRLERAGRRRLRALVFVPLAVLVWLAHVVGWGALCLMVYGAELAHARAQGRRWPAAVFSAGIVCLPLALPFLLLILWRSNASRTISSISASRRAGWRWCSAIAGPNSTWRRRC